MGTQRLRATILFISLSANLAALAVAGSMVHKRGGLPWLLARMGLHRTPAELNQPRIPLEIYQERVDLLRQLPVPAQALVMLGASHTQQGEWSELLPEVTIVNRGVSGDIIDGVTERVTAYLLQQPRKIFIMIGTNDLLNNQPIPASMHRYDHLVATIRRYSPRTVLYLQALPPVLSQPEETVIRFNRELAKLAARQGVDFLDTYTPFLTPDGRPRTELFQKDGIHLSAAGYRVWRDAIRPFVLAQ